MDDLSDLTQKRPRFIQAAFFIRSKPLNSKDRQNIIRYHQERIRAYGPASSMALGWNTRLNQQLRFGVLASIADLSNHSVIDAGCGRGDLAPFLGEKFKGIRYTGIEQVKEFTTLAKKQYGHLTGVQFVEGDFLGTALQEADYILSSGSLNYKNSSARFLLEAIGNLFAQCKKGLGFNLLSKTGFPPGELQAYNPDLVIGFCGTLSKKVILTEGYLEGDFTVFMYK
jgi:SAM-dependent methyltransferase